MHFKKHIKINSGDEFKSLEDAKSYYIGKKVCYVWAFGCVGTILDVIKSQYGYKVIVDWGDSLREEYPFYLYHPETQYPEHIKCMIRDMLMLLMLLVVLIVMTIYFCNFSWT